MKPIFVTGTQRSGTSLVAKIIELAGVYAGNTNTMSENLKIKNYMDSYYDLLSMDKNGQYPLPQISELPIPNNWKERVEALLRVDGWDGFQTWMYKSNRMSQIWPVWVHAFPGARWIIVRRRTGDIVASCEKTAYMKAFKDVVIQRQVGVLNEKEGWLWWIRQHEKRFVEILNEGLNCKVIWPERLIQGDYSQVYEMLQFLGLPWNEKIVVDIEPLLQKTRKKQLSWQK